MRCQGDAEETCPSPRFAEPEPMSLLNAFEQAVGLLRRPSRVICRSGCTTLNRGGERPLRLSSEVGRRFHFGQRPNPSRRVRHGVNRDEGLRG